MSDDRIPVYISMGEARCVGHASRPLANKLYRQNVADLHTKEVEVEPGKEAYTDDDGREVPAEPPKVERQVVGLKLKPFTVMAVTIDRGRVSRKQIMDERAAEPDPFPEGVDVSEVAAPETEGGITVGQDDWRPTAGQKEEATKGAAKVDMEVVGMSGTEIDKIAAQHIPDISSAMGGGPRRSTVPLIQSRSYSGHSWEWGDTHIDMDELWGKLDDKERAWFHDEVMEVVQNDSPTKAKDEPVAKKLVAPGDATYDEMAKDIDKSKLHRRD